MHPGLPRAEMNGVVSAWPLKPGGEPRSRVSWIESVSSPRSILNTRASATPSALSAVGKASTVEVLPTPVGPMRMTELGREG
jgi:hypothetical protein